METKFVLRSTLEWMDKQTDKPFSFYMPLFRGMIILMIIWQRDIGYEGEKSFGYK